MKQGTAAATTVDQIIDTRVFTPTAVLGDSCWRPEIWACYQNPGCVSTGRAGQFRVSHWLVWGQWHGAPTSVQRGLSTSSWAKAGHLWGSHPAAWETWEKLQMYVVYKNKCCKDLRHTWAHPFAQKWVFTLISQREKKHAARTVYSPLSAAVSLLLHGQLHVFIQCVFIPNRNMCLASILGKQCCSTLVFAGQLRSTTPNIQHFHRRIKVLSTRSYC